MKLIKQMQSLQRGARSKNLHVCCSLALLSVCLFFTINTRAQTPPCPPNGITWTPRTAAENNNWRSVTYGNGLFVAVAFNGTNEVMTSPDGITWTARTAAENNNWRSVTYGNGLFVAVSNDGTNQVMTSPDGITWTARTAAENIQWYSVTYAIGLFVAVAVAENSTTSVMTSPDGITWTSRTATEKNAWFSVTYANGVFVAVAFNGANRVMTSPDGITWTARAAAENNQWVSVTYGNGVFVAVSLDGANRVMTSPDGITWTARTAAENNFWNYVTYGNGLFVAVSNNGTNRVMTSPDGITWTARMAAENTAWRSVTYGNGVFVAVASSGTNQVMTSLDGITPSVSITANPGNSITRGTNVTFTATPTNGGSTPAYQWKKNDLNVGTNSATYTDAALANNDLITCVMTGSDACAVPATATGNNITMSVTCPDGITPSVSITANPGNSITPGTNVTFTATPTNGGSTPAYQWKKNNLTVGTNSATYTDAALANNDLITCIMTGSDACAVPATATGNNITMSVCTPSVGGTISGGATVCSGTNLTTLNLANQVGSIQKWQSSLTYDFAGATDIANTTTSLTASNLTQTTYYRAVVKSGICAADFSATATVTVNSLPTASISGTTAVCQNAPFPPIIFSGSNSTAPYTFTYQINDGANLTLSTTNGNNVSIHQTTAASGAFEYSLVSVQGANSCSQSAGGTATITVNAPPVVSIPQTELCTGQTLTLSPISGGTWLSSNPSSASVTHAGLVTGLSAGVVNFTFTPTATGCPATTGNVLIKQTPSSNLTASKVDVCPNTVVTLNAHCSIPTATVNWNPGAPTVTPNAATIPYVYKAGCSLEGCLGNETSVEVRTHRILVDMKDMDVGVLPLPVVRAVKDNMAPTNTVTAPVFPRRWTFIANSCNASESAVFMLSGPVNFQAIDNESTYAMFGNDARGFYSLDHPNYGNGGSFPNGTYTLRVDMRSADGVGGPFPKNRVAAGSLLATRTLQFTVSNPSTRIGITEQVEAPIAEENWLKIDQNPVSNQLTVYLSGQVEEEAELILVNLQGQSIHRQSVQLTSEQQSEVIPMSHVVSGLYILRAIKGDKVKTIKVVKVD